MKGLSELLGLDKHVPDELTSPQTQMALALGATKSTDQVYGNTVPLAVRDRRRAANRRARTSRQINRRSR